jgi:hypothetical protein
MNRQEHLLVILAEECNEVAQQAAKALRFGIDEQRDLPTSNRERLLHEYNDLMAVVEMLQDEGIYLRAQGTLIEAKKEKVEKYLKYSKELGTLI